MITTERSLLDITLAAAVRDQQMATPDGRPVMRLTEGVAIRHLPTIPDARGSITELYDLRWNWHPDPLVFAYLCSIRPGAVKGWNLHKEHEDRYAILQGELEIVLFDPRPGSATYGEICRVVLSGQQKSLMSIPTKVWHADHNIGTTDAVFVNFPTSAYDHENPDKYRLPLDTPLIPFSFGSARGW